MQKDDLARLALFASVMSIAPDGIITVDEEQLILYFNEGAEQIFGYRREEVVGRPLGLLLPERLRATHAEHIRNFGVSRVAARLMGERQEISGLHKDGHEFPAEAAICQLAIGQHRVFTVLIRDITERKRRETHTQILMRELEHRVHNVLARVRIVIERGAEGQSSLQEFRQSLLARIHSMTHAHQLLQRSNWFGVSIKDLIADQLKPMPQITTIASTDRRSCSIPTRPKQCRWLSTSLRRTLSSTELYQCRRATSTPLFGVAARRHLSRQGHELE